MVLATLSVGLPGVPLESSLRPPRTWHGAIPWLGVPARVATIPGRPASWVSGVVRPGYAAAMSDEFLVLRLYPLSDTEEAQIKLQNAADDGYELVEVVPSTDSAMVIMKRRKRSMKSGSTNPYLPRGA